MTVFDHRAMTPRERKSLQRLDEMVLNASPEELRRIQDADSASQLDGCSLCDVWPDPGAARRR